MKLPDAFLAILMAGAGPSDPWGWSDRPGPPPGPPAPRVASRPEPGPESKPESRPEPEVPPVRRPEPGRSKVGPPAPRATPRPIRWELRDAAGRLWWHHDRGHLERFVAAENVRVLSIAPITFTFAPPPAPFFFAPSACPNGRCPVR